MTAESPGEPPILDYATPRSISRQAELDRYVQDLIAKGAGPLDIRRYFRRDRDAIQYFCEVKGQLCGADRLGDRCLDCGNEAKDLAIQLGWRVELKVYYVDIPITRPPGRALVTRHPICAECGPKWRRNLRWDALRCWAFRIAILFTGMMLFGKIASSMQLGKGEPNLVRPLVVLGSLFALVAIGRFIMSRAVRASRPKALNQLMPRGVSFVRCGEVLRRDGGEDSRQF